MQDDDHDDDEDTPDEQAGIRTHVTRAVADCAVEHVLRCWSAQACKGQGKSKGQGKKAKKDFLHIACTHMAVWEDAALCTNSRAVGIIRVVVMIAGAYERGADAQKHGGFLSEAVHAESQIGPPGCARLGVPGVHEGWNPAASAAGPVRVVRWMQSFLCAIRFVHCT